jgi:hypothetical protein
MYFWMINIRLNAWSWLLPARAQRSGATCASPAIHSGDGAVASTD